jgi:hypothetical protein
MGWSRALTKNLFYFVNWSRNKLISIKSIDYSLVIYSISQLDCPKTIKLRSPRAPHWLRLMSHLFPIKPACFWLVVAFLFVFGGHLRPWCIFVPGFSGAQLDGPNNEITSHRIMIVLRAVFVNLHADQRWWRQQWCWQRGNKVNKDNNNNMTTTQ